MARVAHHHNGGGGGKKSNKSSKKNNGGGDDGSASKDDGGTSSNAIPIFLKKTYRMIETCDPQICSWTTDGDMFVVKNPELFASEIIPQYFDHNKFSSFARQLNFYGFRKIQTKPIRNEDFDKSTANHVTFFNEKFKRGRHDLLKEIQRSTRGGGAQASLADQAREMDTLRNTVSTLEQRVMELESRWQELTVKMDREIQAKVELAMMDLLSSRGGSAAAVAASQGMGGPSSATQQMAQYMGMPQLPTSFGDAAILQRAERSFGSIGRNPPGTWENPLVGTQAARAFSTASATSSLGQQQQQNQQGGGGQGGDASSSGGGGAAPTLPPHPKQKNLPPPTMGIPQSASGGMRQLSGGGMRQMSGGGHNMTHNMSVGGRSMSSATNSSLLRSAWEEKFFSTLMMTDPSSRAASLAGLANGMNAGGMAGGDVSGLAALAAAQQQMQNQQQQQQNAAGYAAYMQERVQRGASMGRGGGGVGNNVAQAVAEAAAQGNASLKRQTTAEILLEAAGELGNNGGGAKAKKGSGGGGNADDE